MCLTFILFWHDNIKCSTNLQGKRKASTSTFQSNPVPLSHLPSISPSFSLWSLSLEQIRAKWSYRVSAPLTNVYRRDGAEQPFNNAEWILLVCSATFPTFLPQVLLQFLWQEERHGGKREWKMDILLQTTNGKRKKKRVTLTEKLWGKIKTIYSPKVLLQTHFYVY